MGNEVIHLLEAPVVMGQRKVVAPATGHSIDLAHGRCVLLPRGRTSGELTDSVPKRLLCRRTRLRVHVQRSLLRVLPAEGEAQKLETIFMTLEHSGLPLIERQSVASQPAVQPRFDPAAFAGLTEDYQIVSYRIMRLFTDIGRGTFHSQPHPADEGKCSRATERDSALRRATRVGLNSSSVTFLDHWST